MDLKPPGENASLEESLKFLIKSAIDHKAQLSTVTLQIADTRDLLALNQERISTLETQVTTMGKELKAIKETVNHREQLTRNLNIRILGLPLSEDKSLGPDASAAAAKQAYDRIVRPLLVAAKAKGIITTLPSIANTITHAYRLKFRTQSNQPTLPPLIVTLQSPNIKMAVFRAKKDALPVPSATEKAARSLRFTVTEDLTSHTAAFLKLLRENAKVSRAWSVDGSIRYILEGDSNNIIHRVRSVYDPIESVLPK